MAKSVSQNKKENTASNNSKHGNQEQDISLSQAKISSEKQLQNLQEEGLNLVSPKKAKKGSGNLLETTQNPGLSSLDIDEKLGDEAYLQSRMEQAIYGNSSVDPAELLGAAHDLLMEAMQGENSVNPVTGEKWRDPVKAMKAAETAFKLFGGKYVKDTKIFRNVTISTGSSGKG